MHLLLPIVKKAYDVKDPTVGWEFDAHDENWERVYAKTAGEAKTLCGEQNSFISVIARRAKGSDIVLHNGQERTRWRILEAIEEDKRIKERISGVMRFPETEMFYVQKGYVGNCCLWWALGNNGYTTDILKAEKYTREEILKSFVGLSNENRIWLASHVETKISSQVDSQHLDYNFVSKL